MGKLSFALKMLNKKIVRKKKVISLERVSLGLLSVTRIPDTSSDTLLFYSIYF